jgi:hypothetical protein
VRTEELADDGGRASQRDDILGRRARRHSGILSSSFLLLQRRPGSAGEDNSLGTGREKQEATASAAGRRQWHSAVWECEKSQVVESFPDRFERIDRLWWVDVWMDVRARWWTGAGAFKGGPDRRAQRSCGCGGHALGSA